MLAATLCSLMALAAAEPEMVAHADGENVIEVRVLGLKLKTGSLRVSVYDDPKAFPGDIRKAVAKVQMVLGPTTEDPVLRIPGLEPGTYAVSVHHDENGNGEFDTNWMGIPREGWGASRDARGSFGPPKFEDARFKHVGTRTVLNTTLEY